MLVYLRVPHHGSRAGAGNCHVSLVIHTGSVMRTACWLRKRPTRVGSTNRGDFKHLVNFFLLYKTNQPTQFFFSKTLHSRNPPLSLPSPHAEKKLPVDLAFPFKTGAFYHNGRTPRCSPRAFCQPSDAGSQFDMPGWDNRRSQF